MMDEGVTTYRLVPRVQVAVCLFSVIGVVVCVSLGGMGFLGLSVLGIVVFAALALIFGVLIYFRRGQLTVGKVLAYRRGKTAFEVPRTAAVSVRIRRPVWPLQRPTDYSLNVRIGDRTFLLPFAEHWLHGGRAGQRAQQLSECLGVPIEDPRGDLFRSSRLFWLRWMGASEEWKVLLMTTCIGVVLGLSWVILA